MIKYIGQHIFDFISRFRNDIYIVQDDGDEYKISTSSQDLDVTVSGGSSGQGIRFFNTYQDDPVFDFNVGRAQLNIKDDTGGGNPSMLLTTGYNGASGTSVTFTKGRISGGSIVAGQDDDSINTIVYNSYNDAAEALTFAQVQAQIADASDTDEAGKYTIQVATSNGTTSSLRNALYAEGSPSADDVDVTIGHGSTSVVTIPGRVSTNRIDIDGVGIVAIQSSLESFADNDTSLMTSAAIDDRINAAGGGSSVTADPFSTTVIKVLPNQWVINDDVGRPLFVEDDTSNTLGVRCFSTTDEMYAWQKLPTGYKATHVQVHASASTSSAVTARSYNYQTGADNAVSETTGDLNANIDITDIPSSATQDLVIKVAPASGSTIIFGATVTIATI